MSVVILAPSALSFSKHENEGAGNNSSTHGQNLAANMACSNFQKKKNMPEKLLGGSLLRLSLHLFHNLPYLLLQAYNTATLRVCGEPN